MMEMFHPHKKLLSMSKSQVFMVSGWMKLKMTSMTLINLSCQFELNFWLAGNSYYTKE